MDIVEKGPTETTDVADNARELLAKAEGGSVFGYVIVCIDTDKRLSLRSTVADDAPSEVQTYFSNMVTNFSAGDFAAHEREMRDIVSLCDLVIRSGLHPKKTLELARRVRAAATGGSPPTTPIH